MGGFNVGQFNTQQFNQAGGPTPGNPCSSPAGAYIYQALRKIGQIRPGYLPSPELLNDALAEWGLFFDELGAERNTQYSNPHYEYPVTGPGSQTNGNGYDIGPTATDWVGPRPESIIRANLVFTSQGPQPIYIPLQPVTQEEWAALSIQQIPAQGVTSIFWYDPQYPNGVFNVFPPINANAIQIYQWGVLVPPSDLNQPWCAPPGYADGVIYGLAERLYHMATKNGMVANPVPYNVIAGKALRAWDKIRRVNRGAHFLRNDFGGHGRSGAPLYDQNVRWTGNPY